MPAQPFDAVFESQRRCTIASGLLEHEFDGSASAQVFCAAITVAMLFEASGNIDGDAGIETAVRATKYVQAVAHQCRRSGVSALESIAQNAEGADLQAVQVFLGLGE